MYSANDHAYAICAYKESPYLEQCILSLIKQDLTTNIIMVTSTPNAHIGTLAAQYEIPLTFSNTPPGIASDWNFAIASANKPLVTVAHQDDLYCAEYSTKMLAAVNSVERPLLFFTNYGEIRDDTVVDDNKLLQVKRRMLAPLQNGRFSNSRFIRRRILSFGSAICCPSVTIATQNLPIPLFDEDFKCDLDWKAWERASVEEGGFLYEPNILMYHRIHEESETTALIENNVRSQEDLAMFKMFWPDFIARLINRFYSSSQKSNR